MNKKNRKVKELIVKNNELREKLFDENKEYYENLLLYIRTSGLFYDDYEIETLLIQILQDVISAQENGESARDFFGKSPQEAANELVSNLGHASKFEILKLVGIIFGISAFFPILSMLGTDKGINPIVIILDGILSFITIGIAFIILHRGIYGRIIKNKIVSFVLLWILLTLIIGTFTLIYIFTPDIWNFYITSNIKISIIILILLLSIVAVAIKKREDRRMIVPFLPTIWILGVFGICSNISWTKEWMSSRDGKIISVILIISATVLFYFQTYLLSREKKIK